MSNQQNPYVIPENAKRPGTVVVVAIILILIAILNLFASIAALYLGLQPGEAETLYGSSTSDWVWYFSSLLSFVLFLIFIWLARGQLQGSAQSWMIVNVLAIINIFFAFFQLFYGSGFISIILSLLVLVLNNARGAKDYFMSNLPPEVKAQIMAAQEQQAAANAAAAAVAARQAAEAAQTQGTTPASPAAEQTPPSTSEPKSE